MQDQRDGRESRDILSQDAPRETSRPGRVAASPGQMQVVSGLSGGISHAFGNILQAVETNLVLAKMAIDDRKRALYLIDQSLSAGRNGAALITKLLAFSRQMLLVPHRVDLNQWLAREAERWAEAVGAGIRVRPRTSPAPVEVIVDEARLTDAIVALLDNARYGETGGQPSHTGLGVDVPAVARACGFAEAHSFTAPLDVAAARALLLGTPGPVLGRFAIDAAERPRVMPSRDGHHLRARFRAALLGEAAG